MKQALRKSAVAAVRGLLRVTGERGRRITSQALALRNEVICETIETIATPRGRAQFYCLGEISQWRAQTLLTKEPETIEWIDSFEPGDVFWDIGANMGLYSIYAGIRRDIRVLAFEPSAANYFLLNRNIEINGLDGVARAYCLAFSDQMSADTLNMQNTGLAGALSSFGATVDESGHEFTPIFRQGMVGYSIDQFIAEFKSPFPTHIKIDVDGIEDRIVAGAGATLADARLKSISIELDAEREDYSHAVISAIEAAGLSLTARRRSEMLDGSDYEHIFNYQFRRLI